MSLGTQLLKQTTGRPVRLSCDGYPERPFIGVTIAWDTVPAQAGADTKQTVDDMPIYVGERALRVGQLLCKITAAGANQGKYGPYKSDATDGRQTIARGDCLLVDYSIKQAELTVWDSNLDNDHIGGIIGGGVWRQRLKIQGNLEGVATDPTLAQIMTAFPRLELSPVE